MEFELPAAWVVSTTLVAAGAHAGNASSSILYSSFESVGVLYSSSCPAGVLVVSGRCAGCVRQVSRLCPAGVAVLLSCAVPAEVQASWAIRHLDGAAPMGLFENG